MTPTEVVLLVASLLDSLGVPYVVVGSLASSARGVPRSTNDAKLLWYRTGGMVSDRQWEDVIGLIRVQRAALDAEYLRTWAATLVLTDLLDQALAEA